MADTNKKNVIKTGAELEKQHREDIRALEEKGAVKAWSTRDSAISYWWDCVSFYRFFAYKKFQILDNGGGIVPIGTTMNELMEEYDKHYDRKEVKTMDISEIKALRVEIDATKQKVKRLADARPEKGGVELTLSFRALQTAKYWLGEVLGEMGNPLPKEFADKAE